MEKLSIGNAELGVLAGMLRKVDFFAPLTIGQLEKVLPHVMLNSYSAGETVFDAGEPGDAFYIIYKGKVDVRLPKWLVMSKTVASLPAGAFFGEIALISDEPRTASIVCAEPTQLFTLLAADFQFVLEENPAAKAEMKRISERRKFDSKHST